MVTLQHVSGEAPRRESVLALLHFLYTAKTERVHAGNVMEVLALVGGAQESGDGTHDCGGYLQLRDAATLRAACEVVAGAAAQSGDDDVLLSVLSQAHKLGAERLKNRALRLTVHRFKDLALKCSFESLQPSLVSEILRGVAIEYDSLLPSSAKGMRYELSVTPSPDGTLENSYESISSPDLSCGAGALGTSGCSEASLVALFDRPVRVRLIRVGVDLTCGDFDGSRLNGAKLQYLAPIVSANWQDAGVSIYVEDGVVRDIELPQVLIVKALRLLRRQRLAVGLLAFE